MVLGWSILVGAIRNLCFRLGHDLHLVAACCGAETINGDNTWWRDSHSLEGKEERHCYVPDDAFDNMVYEVSGGGRKCDEDKKT